MTDQGRGRPRQEEDAMPGRSTLLWLVGTVAAVVFLALVSWGVLRAFTGPPPDAAAPVAGEAGAGPPRVRAPYDRRPQPAGPDSATRDRLESYRWIDRERGLAIVPPAAAMELMVRTGGRIAPGGAEPGTADAGAGAGEATGEGGPP